MRKFVSITSMLFVVICSGLSIEKNIYLVVHPSFNGAPRQYFDFSNHRPEFTNLRVAFKQLAIVCKQLGYEFIVTSIASNFTDAYCIIDLDGTLGRCASKNKFNAIDRQKLILFATEPPAVFPALYDPDFLLQYSKMFTFNDTLVDNKNVFKFFTNVLPLNYPLFQVPFAQKKLTILVAGMKRFGRNIASQNYGERFAIANFFCKKPLNDFALYGGLGKYHWLSGYGGHYYGPIPFSLARPIVDLPQGLIDKLLVLKNYKFVFAFENTVGIDGYISEKIGDAFLAGCVPIYRGPHNIVDYIPKNCFIDMRDFKNYEELYQFIKAMPENEYCRYIKNIKLFLNGNSASRFSVNHFVKTICNVIFSEKNISY